MHPKDIVFRYCKIPHIKQLGYNLKKDILKELSTFLRATPNKDLIERTFSKKVSYNNILFFEEMGFKLKFDYLEETDSYNLILKNNLDMPPIHVKKQTYFHYKFIKKLFEQSKNNKYIKSLFDELGFLDENLFKIEYLYEPYFKIINKIYINEQEYISIELFEKNRLDNYTGILSEKLRLANTILFNQEKCKRAYVFWEDYLTNEQYFENYIKNIINFINDCNETVDEYFRENISFIGRNLINYAEMITSSNSSHILIEDINKLIEWKDSQSAERFYIVFKQSLGELDKIEDFKDGILNLEELNFYIQKLDINYVKDEKILNFLSNLNFNIQIAYNKAVLAFMTKKMKMLETTVYGLESTN